LYRSRAEGEGAEDALKRSAGEYEEVLRLQPGDGQTMLALAEVYRQLNQPKDAVRIWQRYLTLDPGSFEGCLQLGAHYLAMGDSDPAAAAFKKALEVQPNSARAYQALGDI